VVTAQTRLGTGVYVGHLSVLGSYPEDVGERDPRRIAQGIHAGVVIGDRVVIRDQCAIHGGKARPTSIGEGCYVHSGSHVNHDCVLEPRVTLAPGVYLAGNVEVGSDTQVGMAATVHQRIRIGACAMIGMNSTVVRDIPPLALAKGSPARVTGANRVLLQRRGLDAPLVAQLDRHLAHGTIPSPFELTGFPSWIHEVFDGWTVT